MKPSRLLILALAAALGGGAAHAQSATPARPQHASERDETKGPPAPQAHKETKRKPEQAKRDEARAKPKRPRAGLCDGS
jgi:glucose/arabinose dehydrogenase